MVSQKIKWFAIILIIFKLELSVATEQVYRFGPGDIIKISVYLKTIYISMGKLANKGALFSVIRQYKLRNSAKLVLHKNGVKKWLSSLPKCIRSGTKIRPFFIYGE